MTVTASSLTFRGVPLPPDRSLLGYTVSQDAYSALIWFGYEGLPEPRYAVMPLAGEPWDQWPPFTGQAFSASFWDHVDAGNIAGLGPVIAANPGTVFWSEATRHTLGADSCVVTRDIADEDGCVLRAGIYAYSKALEDGAVIPDAAVLLAGAVDLAPRFRKAA